MKLNSNTAAANVVYEGEFFIFSMRWEYWEREREREFRNREENVRDSPRSGCDESEGKKEKNVCALSLSFRSLNALCRSWKTEIVSDLRQQQYGKNLA